MIKMTEFAKRRKEIMQKIGSDSLVILRAAPSIARNHYHEYPYRQNSDFYYLTGFNEPDAVMVLAPKRKDGEFILFNRIRDREKEIWDGYRAGQIGARKQFGADEAFPIHELEKKLPELFKGREKIYYPLGTCPTLDETILNAMNMLRAQVRSGAQAPLAYVDVHPIIHEMRLFKSADEIALMRKAAEISADAQHTCDASVQTRYV